MVKFMNKTLKIYPRLKKYTVLVFLTAVLVTVLDYFTSEAFGNVTSSIQNANLKEMVLLVGGTLGLFALSELIVQPLYDHICTLIEIYMSENTRQNILKKICDLPVFSDALVKRGELYSLTTDDTEALVSLCSSIIPALISISIKMAAVLIFGLILNPLLCFVYFVSLGGGVILQKFLSMIVEKAYMKTWQKQNDFFAQTENVLKNRIAFRTYQKEAYGEDLFNEAQEQYTASSSTSDRIAMPLKIVGIACAILPVLMLCLIGLHLSAEGKVTVAGLLAFFYFCMGSVSEQIHYVDYMLMAKKAFVSAGKVTAFLMKDGEAENIHNSDLEKLQNVKFYYPDSKAGVEDVALTVNKGEKIAIVGENGSGKSTLLQIMAGFLKTEEGSIQRMDSLLVSQNPFFFDGTIKENLCCGDTFSEEKIWQALKKAEGETFVRELDGMLDYQLHNNAADLSGGQKQRLAIARALLHAHDLYLFDESLSALDPLTSDRIMQTLTEEKKTEIFILHQPELTAYVERVICMAEGRIIFDGSQAAYQEWKESYGRKETV